MTLLCILAIAAFLAQQVWLQRKERERARVSLRQKEGVFLDCDMAAKFGELLDDHTMTAAKWREWLPIFEAADREVRSKCPNISLGRNAQSVRDVISNGTEFTNP